MASLNIIRSAKFTPFTLFHRQIFGCVQRLPLTSALGMLQFKSTNVDALDIFAAGILSKAISSSIKSTDSKRETQLLKNGISERKDTIEGENDKAEVAGEAGSEPSQMDIDANLVACMDCNDRKNFKEFVEQVLQTKRLPSDAVILRILSHLCDDQADSMIIISRLIDVCQEKNIAFYARNVEFIPFLSQYLWKIERFEDALNSLNSIFATTNATTKGHILRNYRQIIYDTVRNQDEIILEKVIVNARQMHNKHKNPVLIIYIWSDCFFSELFRNQRKADELFDTHEEIRKTVSKDIGWIALKLLQEHNVDAMHRLIEKFLALNMKREVDVCLTALFDYHYSRDDLRACSEVMNTCQRLATPISQAQNKKLLNLLLKKKTTLKKQSPTKTSVSRFEFKF